MKLTYEWFGKDKLQKFASLESTLLLMGKTGTGKTTLAKEIHDLSRRKDGPFVSINLAVLHEGTIEAELFGYQKGAFTGADQTKKGRVEMAQGGTLFLDEIGELSPRLQTKLLDFLQFKTITPMGSHQTKTLDVRIISATNRELKKEVSQGNFREDLYHRLKMLEITLPGLDELSDYFDSIVHQMTGEFSKKHAKKILKFSECFAKRLEAYAWPGNFRELGAALEYAVMNCDSSELVSGCLPDWVTDSEFSRNDLKIDSRFFSLPLREAVEEFERLFLLQSMGFEKMTLSRLSRKVSLPKATLLRRLRHHGFWQAAHVSENGLEGSRPPLSSEKPSICVS